MKFKSITKAMLMTAGLGTRLRPFTLLKTKALLPLLGDPISQYTIDSLAYCGVSSVVANLHHHFEKSRVGLSCLDFHGGQLSLSDESDCILGSAGGIRKAIHHFGNDPFYLANADVLCDIDWTALARQHHRLRSQWGVSLTLAIFPKGPSGGAYREIQLDSSGQLILGLGDVMPYRPFFVGAAVLEPEAFWSLPAESPADFIDTILRPAIQRGKAGAFLTSGSWYDIGTPELWLNTHLQMINRMEIGNFPSPISRLWKNRIESTNWRFGERVWISKKSRHLLLGKESIVSLFDWAAPMYWDGRGEKLIRAPKNCGPQAVVYGDPSNSLDLKNGIGFGEYWVSCLPIQNQTLALTNS